MFDRMNLKNMFNFGLMQLISFIRTLDYKNTSLVDLAIELEAKGYVNNQGNLFSVLEIKDLVAPLIETDRTYSKKGFGSCGINRDENPCGDASDY